MAYLDLNGLDHFWNNIKDEIGTASDEQVADWLDAHPEATTTVQDGAVTTAKLANSAVTDEKLAQTGSVLSEVHDIRTGADGTTYASAGDAVRSQVSKLSGDVSDLWQYGTQIIGEVPSLEFVTPTYVQFNGNWRTLSGYEFGVAVVDVSNVDVILLKYSKLNDAVAEVAFSQDNTIGSAPIMSYVRKDNANVNVMHAIDVPEGAKYAFIANDVNSSGRDAQATWVAVGRGAETINNLVTEIIELGGGASLMPELNVPDSYALVVGDTFELFWKGIIRAVNPYIYNIRAMCSIGSCYGRKFEVTPAVAGTFPLTINLEDYARNVLDTATVNLVVSSYATSPASTKNVLCVGDSLLQNGQWAYESHRRLTASDGTPTGLGLSDIDYIGTCTKDDVGYEGYGGWTFGSYNTAMTSSAYVWVTSSHTKTAADQHSVYQDVNGARWKIETIETTRLKMIRTSGSTAMPSSGTLTYVSGGTDTSNIVYTSSVIASGNPFWNESTESVDFAAYASRLGVSTIDYCYVMLGWNSTTLDESTYKAQVRTFIDNLLADFPDCKIALMGLQVPSLDGIGHNYGCSWNYYDKMKKVFEFNEWYSEIADEYANVHFVNIAGQFDTENNMQVGTRPVNVRNSDTETYQTNGVHPATSGYNQIADAVYRDLTAQLQ